MTSCPTAVTLASSALWNNNELVSTACPIDGRSTVCGLAAVLGLLGLSKDSGFAVSGKLSTAGGETAFRRTMSLATTRTRAVRDVSYACVNAGENGVGLKASVDAGTTKRKI